MTEINKAHAVIMAGGSGTRFWPLSRSTRPKQFLALGPDDRTLLRATAERLWAAVPPDRTWIVTGKSQRAQVEQELPELPTAQILAEPVGRNTAPCIGWAATHIRRREADAIMAVLPADHYISDAAAYVETVKRGLRAATHGDFVTIGIRPTRPETGYGYIEVGGELDPGVFRARRFVEKPNVQRAQQFVASDRFLWNSGMFFFLASRILDAIRQHLPGIGAQLATFDDAARAGNEAEVVEAQYVDLPSVSIDHGIMEKVDSVSVVPGSFPWSDLGSWTSAWELAERDADANAIANDAISIDARGNYVHAPSGKLVALVGVEDLIVVDTGDALMIVPRSRAQDVREVVKTLKERDDPRR